MEEIIKENSKENTTDSIWRKIDWVNSIFLIVTPILAFTWTPLHIHFQGFKPSLLLFFFVYSIFTSLSVTAGYHRLFAHRSYQAKPWVRFFLLVFGAAAFQNSILRWASDHRRHHRHVDSEEDPYCIKKGFFYAHIGWIFLKLDKKYENDFAPDLLKDPLIRWQHKYYIPLSLFVGLVIPFFVGWSMGSPFGGLLYGGILRVVFTHHSTFFVNSLCHYVGRQPYSDMNTARDSMLAALFTYGEGYHNFHHAFQLDYRNGLRWYQWDPTKWFIRFLSYFGQTYQLKQATASDILRTRLKLQEKKLLQVGAPQERLEQFRRRIEDSQKKFLKLMEEYRESKSNLYRDRLKELKMELKLAKTDLKAAMKSWSIYTRMALKGVTCTRSVG